MGPGNEASQCRQHQLENLWAADMPKPFGMAIILSRAASLEYGFIKATFQLLFPLSVPLCAPLCPCVCVENLCAKLQRLHKNVHMPINELEVDPGPATEAATQRTQLHFTTLRLVSSHRSHGPVDAPWWRLLVAAEVKGSGRGWGNSTGGHQLRLLSQLGKMICHIKKMCFQCQLKYISPSVLCLKLPPGRLCHLNPRKINIKLCWYPGPPPCPPPCPFSGCPDSTCVWRV